MTPFFSPLWRHVPYPRGMIDAAGRWWWWWWGGGRLHIFRNLSKTVSTLLSYILWRSSEIASSGILWTMSLLPRSWQMSIGGRILVCRGLRPFWDALVCWGINFKCISGSQADLRAFDKIVLTHTSDNLVCAAFFSKKVFIVLDLCLYCVSDSLKHQFELKSPIPK